MDIILPGYSKVYVALAVGYLLLDYNVLRRLMKPDHWLMLRMPALIVHELSHFIVALLLLGWPRISFKWERDASGTVEMGRVSYGPPMLGGFGHTLISVAPLLLYFVAWGIARHILSQPQPLLVGLGWLVAVYLCVSAAAMFSRSDLADVGIIGRVMILLTILQIMVEPVVRIVAFAYVALGRPGWFAELLGRFAVGL
jgi:hypothetical protein